MNQQSELPLSMGLIGSFDPAAIFVILIVIALAMVVGFVILVNRKKRREDQKLLAKKEAPISVAPAPTPEPKQAAPVEVAEPVAAPEAPVAPPPPTKVSDRERLSKGLGKASLFFQQALDRVLGGSEGEQFYQDLEEALLTADVGIGFAEEVTAELRKRLGLRVPKREELYTLLKEVLRDRIPDFPENKLAATGHNGAGKPHVVMIVGVNGAGKTTTVAKLCSWFHAHDQKVLVGAADTFRAAATEQLKQWVERVGAEGVFQKEGADPSAVAFDTVQAAKNRGFDLALVDTAGRLHTKHNLMDELQKMKRVIGKADSGVAPQDIWLVVDGTTGQNALMQAREFHKALGLTGIIITKLDGSAKGGVVLSIMSELKVPVLMVGVGETQDDLIRFNRDEFIEELLSGLK